MRAEKTANNGDKEWQAWDSTRPRLPCENTKMLGGRGRFRTDDLRCVKPVLSQTELHARADMVATGRSTLLPVDVRESHA